MYRNIFNVMCITGIILFTISSAQAITYGEPDVLLRFYLNNKETYEVITCASYVRYKNLKLVRRLIKSYKWNPQKIPASLWTKKKL